MLPLTLVYDHRVIDGVLGARFLAAVCAALSGPDGAPAPGCAGASAG